MLILGTPQALAAGFLSAQGTFSFQERSLLRLPLLSRL